jgi:hypothetical protein
MKTVFLMFGIWMSLTNTTAHEKDGVRSIVLLLLGEKAGMRAVISSIFTGEES